MTFGRASNESPPFARPVLHGTLPPLGDFDGTLLAKCAKQGRQHLLINLRRYTYIFFIKVKTIATFISDKNKSHAGGTGGRR